MSKTALSCSPFGQTFRSGLVGAGLAFALPIVLSSMLISCGKSSHDRNKNDTDAGMRPSPTSQKRLAAMEIVLGEGGATAQLPSHDAYEVEVKYPGSAEAAPYLGRKSGKLSPGMALIVGSVRTLPRVKIIVKLLAGANQSARCETAEFDLSKVENGARIPVKLTCIALGVGAPTAAPVTLPAVGVVRKTADVLLTPEFSDAVEDLLARAEEGLLFLNTQVTYDGRPAQAELAWIPSQGATDQGVLRLRLTELGGVPTVPTAARATLSNLATLESDVASLAQVRALLLAKGTLALSGKVLAQVTTGPALSREYVDASVTLSAQGAARLVSANDGITRTLRVRLAAAFTGLDGTTAAEATAPLALEFALRDASSTDLGSITVGSYNVENMWDDVSTNGFHYEDYAPATSNWYADEMFVKKVRHVATAIALAGAPDVLALEEIESGLNSSRSLELLKPELAKLGYRYFVLGRQQDDNAAAVTTAIISKFPVTQNWSLPFVYQDAEADAKANKELADSSRDPQVVEINVQGRILRVYVGHFKSKGSGGLPGERMRKATGALIKSDIDAARKANPLLDIVVLGDLNTDYSDDAIVAGLNSTGDEVGMLAESPSDKLYNLWFELPEAERCSYSFGGFRSCIDNIFVSDSLFDNHGLTLRDGSFKVVGHQGLAQSILLNADGTPLRWQIIKSFTPGAPAFSKHLAVGYSDHLPVVATFDVASVNPTKATKATRVNPSTTDLGPKVFPEDVVPVCTAADATLDLMKDDVTLPQNFGKCATLTGVKLPLRREGDRDVAIDVGPNRLVVGATRSFGANKAFATSLQGLGGAADLTAVRGRIGYFNGRIAILPHDVASDITLNNYVKCGAESDVVGSVDTLETTKLEAKRLACLSYSGLTAQVGAIDPRLSGTQNVGTITTSAGFALTLRMDVAKARALFTAPGAFRVQGYGVLDHFAPRNDWQINLSAFGQATGAISVMPPL